MIYRIANDIRGYIFKLLEILNLNFSASLSTILCYCNCFCRNIKIGKKCVFFGFTRFIRVPGSHIIVEEYCTFRSTSASNLIGLNRRCSISALRRDSSVIIGKNCGFSGTVISAASYIKIGNNVLCGANTLLTDFDWHEERLASRPAPIIIEDNVWLGLNVVILKGVTIGKNSIIGANSLVTSTIPENVIAGGNPCKVIRPL